MWRSVDSESESHVIELRKSLLCESLCRSAMHYGMTSVRRTATNTNHRSTKRRKIQIKVRVKPGAAAGRAEVETSRANTVNIGG